MAAVSSLQATEAELGAVTREHERDRAVLEAQWRGELTQLRETQRRTYHQWIEGAYKEMTSSGGRGTLGNPGIRGVLIKFSNRVS